MLVIMQDIILLLDCSSSAIIATVVVGHSLVCLFQEQGTSVIIYNCCLYSMFLFHLAIVHWTVTLLLAILLEDLSLTGTPSGPTWVCVICHSNLLINNSSFSDFVSNRHNHCT